MNTFAVRCENAESTLAVGKMDANKVTITLASGKTLVIYATDEPDVLSFTAADVDTLIVYLRRSGSLEVELR